VLCAAAHNTYIPTWEGWVYLATVIDCYSKKVIGWAMDDNCKTPPAPRGVVMYPPRSGERLEEMSLDLMALPEL
jgi:hypothetical protein